MKGVASMSKHSRKQSHAVGSFPLHCGHGLEKKHVAGWWYTYPSEKCEFVSSDYYSMYCGKKRMFQTTNQMVRLP